MYMYNGFTLLYSSNIVNQLYSKNLQTINAGEGVEKRELFCTVGENVNYTATVENSMEVP